MSSSPPASQPLASAHDVELAARARHGDRRAFSELVRRHGSAVRSLLRRAGAKPADADRLARDAFIEAFERIGEFRGEAPFQAWVKTIAAKAVARAWRGTAGEGDLWAEASDPPPGEGLRDLDQALAGLEPLERLCVTLCYGGGLSRAEAAATLNQPAAEVRAILGRALEQLRAGHISPGTDAASRGASDG
jgi:RNA polymerase sigma-70 factor (ECF subfamily)